MSSASNRNIFGSGRDSFRERQSKALLRRVGTGITGKVLAHALDVHPDTVMNWVNGRVTMDGAAIEALSAFFCARGDNDFLNDLYDQSDVAREPERTAFLGDLCLWFTGEGATHEAPAGHAQFVRETLKISSGAQDLAAYAIRNLGWVECLVRPDGRVGLRYAATAADPAAATRARDWLLFEGRHSTGIELTVWRDGNWETISPPTISDAARLLDRAGVVASIDRITERDWDVQRLSLDEVTHEGMASLLTSFEQGADVLVAAAGLELMETSSLFAVEGGDVMSLWIGRKLDLPIESFANRNVLDRSDRKYGALIHTQILKALQEGPTFYRLDIEIAGRRRRYERVAIPQDRRLVITSTRLLENGGNA